MKKRLRVQSRLFPGGQMLHCPFCGSFKATIRERGREQFVPMCTECDCRFGLFSSKEEALKGWNTRAADKGLTVIDSTLSKDELGTLFPFFEDENATKHF
jgi:hypothetical protein